MTAVQICSDSLKMAGLSVEQLALPAQAMSRAELAAELATQAQVWVY